MIEEDGYLTVGEVAKELGVSRSAVWKWIREGKIKNVVRVITGRYYIAVEEVERLKNKMKKHRAKVFKPNEYSLAIRIPKRWAKMHGIEKGDYVLVFDDGEQLIVLPEREGGGKE